MIQTYAQVLAAASQQLLPIVGDTAAQDARILLAHAIGIEKGRVILVLQDRIDLVATAKFDALIARRAQHQPIAQIIGIREFWGRTFAVTPDVLDPRPETESLIVAALEGPKPKRILDLGTGSGCLLLTLLAEWPQTSGIGADLSEAALSVAKGNATQLGIESAEFVHSDWYSAIEGRFDLIVSNPPYIAADEMDGLDPDVARWEPRIALTPEGDGLEAYRLIAARLREYLNLGGRALFEIGYQQGADVVRIFKDQGFGHVDVIQDLNGHDRVIQVRE